MRGRREHRAGTSVSFDALAARSEHSGNQSDLGERLLDIRD